jgi:hypothetical protein
MALFYCKKQTPKDIRVGAKNVTIRTPYNKPLNEIREKQNGLEQNNWNNSMASAEIIRPAFKEGSTLPYLGKNYSFRIISGLHYSKME